MTADDTVTAKLAEWETLVEEATEGPWGHWGQGWIAPVNDPQRDPVGVPQNTIPRKDADAEFIAAARHIVPALLGFVREVRAGHAREPYVDEPSEGFCRDCQRGGAAGTWPCPTEQAAQKWIGGEG